jgi:oligopeptide/dipeptide ABC transporter ATP-binding protein
VTALFEAHEITRTFPVGRMSLLHAVRDVSFTMQEGECLGLVGESGCGKSTLSRISARLLDPTSGKIFLRGRELSIEAKRFARDPDRADIQVVFQDPADSLNPRMSVFDIVADPLRQLLCLRGKALAEKVSRAAERAGIAPELLKRFPHQLSGGQQARVGIARAIAVNPSLLILDEPTSALDVSMQAVILRLLKDLRSGRNMSYLFISHNLHVVRLLCDRTLIMYLGRVVESGPTDEVFKEPCHPYTQALVEAIPSVEGLLGRHPPLRRLLPGEPQSPIDPDPGVCCFAGRCPQEFDPCRQQHPELLEVLPGRRVACHRYASN